MTSFRFRWTGLLAVAASLLAPARADGDGPPAGEIPSLFIDCGVPLPPTMGPAGRAWPERSRGLRLAAPGIAVLEKLSGNAELSAKLRIPGGRKGELVVDMRGTSSDPKTGARTWVGRLPYGDGGELVLSSRPRTGVGLALLGSPGRVWHGALRSDSHGSFELLSVRGTDCLGLVRSLDGLSRCGGVLPRSRRPPRDDGRLPAPDRARSCETVDLLVIATLGAINLKGDLDQVRAQVLTGVGQLNHAFIESGVRGAIRLVGCESLQNPAPDPADHLVNGVSADDDADHILDQLRAGAAPWAAEAHALRCARGADLVCVVFHGTEPVDGRAFRLSKAVSQPEPAFAIVPLKYATSEYVLAHEMGHCLGCCHDKSDSDCEFPITVCCRGFHFEDPRSVGADGLPARRTTLMGLPWDPATGLTYVRVLRFSNPDVRYAGSDGPFMGDSTADNARTLRCTLRKVACYRPSAP